MKYTIAAFMIFGLTAGAETNLEGGRASFNTNTMRVVVENGIVTSIYNKLTGSAYILGPPASGGADFSTALIYTKPGVSKGEKATVVGPTPTAAGAQVLVPAPMPLKDFSQQTHEEISNGARYRFSSAESFLEITYSLDESTGDLLITQHGGGNQKGLAGVRFAVGPITCNGDLLVPAMGGIRAANTRYQFEAAVWQWPTGWQLPLLIFQHPGGGLWFHTEDTKRRLKSAKYREEGAKGTWTIALDTENVAPFRNHDSADSVTWRLNVYAGSWTAPVDRYRQWAYRAFEIAAKEKIARPAWVDDIALVIKHADLMPENLIVPYLDALKDVVDPKRTLLFMTNWVDGSKGMMMPYWQAGAKGIKFNDEAHKRGFRTMYFANYIGMTSNHPRFAEFKPYVIRNPYTNEMEGWNLKGEWSAAADVALYYVSPALKAWRDLAIGEFKRLFDAHPADGLFIDQAFLMFNDGNGLQEGMTTIDGNLAYHEQLVRAIPGVAIGGESVNEITMQWESFFEHHPLSLHMPTDDKGKALGWKIEPGAFDRMVPILPRFLMPHTMPIGYLGFPETKSPFYAGWRDALRVYHGIPTLTFPTYEELKDESGEVRRAMREAMSRK